MTTPAIVRAPGYIQDGQGFLGRQIRTHDHSESIQIYYDPTVISYGDLLKLFWKGHDPSARSWSTQYKAAVFYHNDEQRKLAEETRDRIEATQKTKVRTEILPFSRFYVAEAYHQKYGLRGQFS